MGAVEQWVVHMVGSPWVFVVVALVLAVGSVAVFLPSQGLVVAVASLLLARGGAAPLVGALAIVAAGGMVLGDLGLFALARWVHLDQHPWLNRRRVREARESIETRYRAMPTRIAILGRLIPVGRLTTNLIGADSGLGLRRFLIACVTADLVWAAYCVGTAAAFGHWSRQNPFLVTVVAVTASILLGLGIRLVETAVMRRRSAVSDPAH